MRSNDTASDHLPAGHVTLFVWICDQHGPKHFRPGFWRASIRNMCARSSLLCATPAITTSAHSPPRRRRSGDWPRVKSCSLSMFRPISSGQSIGARRSAAPGQREARNIRSAQSGRSQIPLALRVYSAGSGAKRRDYRSSKDRRPADFSAGAVVCCALP